jgi:hypothetical protein
MYKGDGERKREKGVTEIKSVRKRKKGVKNCFDVESEGGISVQRRNNRHGNET